jgi:hypothetical protein
LTPVVCQRLFGKERGERAQRAKVLIFKLPLFGGPFSRKSLVGGERIYRVLIFVSLLGLLTNTSHAIPVGGEVIMSGEENFDTGDLFAPKRIDALVSYEVLKYDADVNDGFEYLYTYRILNEDNSSVGLGLFSVGIFEDCNAYNPDFEAGPGDEVAPTAMFIVGNPPQSVTYLFQLEDIGIGEQSTLLTSGYGLRDTERRRHRSGRQTPGACSGTD